MQSYKNKFGMSALSQVMYCALGGLSAVLGLVLFLWGGVHIIVTLLLVPVGAAIALYALRHNALLYEDRLEIGRLFGTERYMLAELKKVEVGRMHNFHRSRTNFLWIYPQEGKSKRIEWDMGDVDEFLVALQAAGVCVEERYPEEEDEDGPTIDGPGMFPPV